MNPNIDILMKTPASFATFSGCPIINSMSLKNHRKQNIGRRHIEKIILALLTVSAKY